MRITSVKATALTERAFWARPVERTVTIRAPGNGRVLIEAHVPIPGSVLAVVETDEGLAGDTLAEAMGCGRRWHARKGHIICDIERGELVLQEMVEKAGAVVEDGAVRGVIVETKNGREATRARVVVDATGDADIGAFAGTPL